MTKDPRWRVTVEGTCAAEHGEDPPRVVDEVAPREPADPFGGRGTPHDWFGERIPPK